MDGLLGTISVSGNRKDEAGRARKRRAKGCQHRPLAPCTAYARTQAPPPASGAAQGKEPLCAEIAHEKDYREHLELTHEQKGPARVKRVPPNSGVLPKTARD